MIDGDVQTAIKSILDVGLTAQGLNVIVQQSFNPTTQGVPLDATVFFTKILSRRFGSQGRKIVYDEPNDQFIKTETYFIKATYQIGADITQDLSDINSLTAYDVVELSSAIFQTEETLATLRGQGLSIERIMEIRTPNILSDSDQFKQDPSFDLILSYKNELTNIVPAAGVTGTIQTV